MISIKYNNQIIEEINEQDYYEPTKTEGHKIWKNKNEIAVYFSPLLAETKVKKISFSYVEGVNEIEIGEEKVKIPEYKAQNIKQDEPKDKGCCQQSQKMKDLLEELK